MDRRTAQGVTMPAPDIFHDQVKNALVKDGWTITDDPLTIQWGRKKLYVDLGAERLLAAAKSGRKIAVEIKSFITPTSDLIPITPSLNSTRPLVTTKHTIIDAPPSVQRHNPYVL
jgi:hypothetical protein